jgi:hypothetical protein
MFSWIGSTAISLEFEQSPVGKRREPVGQSWLPVAAVIPLAASDNRLDLDRQ